MNTYDYRPTGYLELDTNFDSLNNEERQQLNEAMKQIQEQYRQESVKRAREWVDAAVIPILMSFASETESLLNLEELEDQTIVAEIRNGYGYTLTDANRQFKSILGLADHIDIMRRDEDIILTLVFDYNSMIQ